MKKKLITLVAVFTLVMSLGLLAACGTQSGSTSGASGSTTTETAVLDGLPSNLPNKDHIGYVELQNDSGKECYTCHGNSDAGNPTQVDARIVPEDHYVNKSYDSMAFDPSRVQCQSCHGGPAPTN